MFKRFIYLFLIILSGLFISCGSSDNGTDSTNNNNTNGSMKAKVAGNNWEANTAVVGVYTAGVLTITGQFTNAQTSDSKQVSLTIMQNAAVGTFTVGLLGPAQARYTEASLQNLTGDTYIGTSGTIEITELSDTSAKGTFSFSGALNGNGSVIQVTNGTFTAKF